MTYNVVECVYLFVSGVQQMIHSCVTMYRFFFGFSSHMAYYAVLIRGPHAVGGSW